MGEAAADGQSHQDAVDAGADARAGLKPADCEHIDAVRHAGFLTGSKILQLPHALLQLIDRSFSPPLPPRMGSAQKLGAKPSWNVVVQVA